MKTKPKRTVMQNLRRTFGAGLLILLPLFATYVLVSFLFRLVSRLGAPIVGGLVNFFGLDGHPVVGALIPLVNLLLSLFVIFAAGLVGTHFLGKRVLKAFEDLLMRVPLVKNVYGAVKQMIDTFQGSGRSFQRVVLVEYPYKGNWVMGFVASERPDVLHLLGGGTCLAVFIPTTPNPTSGFLVMVSPEQVVEVDYSVEEAFKFIISSGIVGRDFTRPAAASPPKP